MDTRRVHPQNKNSPFLLQKCFDTAQNWWIFRKQMLSSWIHYRHWYCKYPKQMVVPPILQIVHLKFKFNNSVNLVSAFTFSHKSGRWDKLPVANGPTQSFCSLLTNFCNTVFQYKPGRWDIIFLWYPTFMEIIKDHLFHLYVLHCMRTFPNIYILPNFTHRQSHYRGSPRLVRFLGPGKNRTMWNSY